MDDDLLRDLYGFLPKKYFVSRVINKSLGYTLISFVDYQRNFYRCENNHWRKNSTGKHYQEYGPYYRVCDHSNGHYRMVKNWKL